jgi:hypothetical protein
VLVVARLTVNQEALVQIQLLQPKLPKVAQMVERRPEEPRVGRSIRLLGTIYFYGAVAEWTMARVCKTRTHGGKQRWFKSIPLHQIIKWVNKICYLIGLKRIHGLQQ